MFPRKFVNHYSQEKKVLPMASKVITTELSLPWFQVNALAFIPDGVIKPEWALFTHGYTSHKGDCLNWAARLVEVGVPCLIFDQPGHYLGSFNEVNDLEEFKQHAHELFGEAYLRLQALMEQAGHIALKPQTIVLGGHSLGAYTSIKALELPLFADFKRISLAIGCGIGQRQATHLFETAFYEKTLSIRRQLVSPALDSKAVFAWLKEAKETLTVSGERIHLITGEDDVVVGPGGMEAMIEVLEKNNNVVTFDRPKRLPHHEPGLAIVHIYSFLKNHFGW